MSANKTLGPPVPSPTLPRLRTLDDRLSLPISFRIPLACTVGGASGFILGLAKGSTDSGLRFQAENAHRLPTTQTGWYLYHKSKNYNMLLGGIVEGFKQSFKYSIWVGTFFVVEEGVDRGRAAGARFWKEARGGEFKRGATSSSIAEQVEEKQVAGNRDCFSSMLAGLGTAGIFSAWNKFPVPTAVRTAKMGAKAGLAFGLLQDALSLVKGRRVGYVEFIKRQIVGVKDEEDLENAIAGQVAIRATEG